jgi:multidrug efflux pump subunit AcrB
MINWFVKNHVAANLVMVGTMVAGIAVIVGKQIPLEVFPEYPPDEIQITIPYRGANPAEVEESVIVRTEEAIADVTGVKKIISQSGENSGRLTIEIEQGLDVREVLDDVKTRIDAISNFPEDSERPVIRLSESYRSVINVVLSGDLQEKDLRKLGEIIRDEISTMPNVTRVELQGVRPYEIAIETDESALQRHQLTFDQVATAIRRSSIDVGAGSLKTDGGQITLRTRGRAYSKEAFESIVIATTADGARLTLRDIATVKDGFEETPLFTRYNNKPCVLIAVAREGNQNAIDIANKVKDYVTAKRETLPGGVTLSYWNDSSKVVKDRLSILVSSSIQSVILVFVVLALFLRIDLAFWTVLGIPMAFLGAIALMPILGISINIVSLFAFIMVLGIVVDDAIVVVENVHVHRSAGASRVDAAIMGTKEISTPVVFGVFTTMLAFIPMIISGSQNDRWQMQIALIVIVVLAFSLIESKLILPSHLARDHGAISHFVKRFLWFPFVPIGWVISTVFGWLQRIFQTGLDWVIMFIYRPVLHFSLTFRYLVVSFFIGLLIVAAGYFEGGHITFVAFSPVQSERVSCRLAMQEGTPVEVTEEVVMRIEEVARQMKRDYLDSDGTPLIDNILTSVGATGIGSGRSRGNSGESHLGEVTFNVLPPENRKREIDNFELTRDWRKRIGPVIGAKEVAFRAEIMRRSEPVDIQLTGQDFASMADLADKIKNHLATFPELFDITTSLDQGRDELRLQLTPEGEQLGLTTIDLARQVRQAFFGEEVQRMIRGRDELRVMLRYPEKDRKTMDSLSSMKIRTPSGDEIPFVSVARLNHGLSYPSLQRINRQRSVNILADADKKTANLDAIRSKLEPWLNDLVSKHAGIQWTFAGEAEDQREGLQAVEIGMWIVVFGLYALLAIPLRSYFQPLIILAAVPFGIVGALIGHNIHNLPLSMLSLFGLLALAGVAVNDGLVLVDFINRKKNASGDASSAIKESGPARLRPVLLTTLTTVAGLAPLLFLKSVQAQVLIPMAVSLVYGITMATFITLLLIPVLYQIGEDFRKVTGALMARPSPSPNLSGHSTDTPTSSPEP